jgi:hypothetical protein
MFTVVVVFPTPPFWFAIAITLPILLTDLQVLPSQTALLYHRMMIKGRKNVTTQGLLRRFAPRNDAISELFGFSV